MQKSFRSLVLVAAVSFVAVPTVHADRMGTNPRPTRQVSQQTSTLQLVAYTVMAYLGM